MNTLRKILRIKESKAMEGFVGLPRDPYQGITITSSILVNFEQEELKRTLPQIISLWLSEGVRGIWVSILLKDSHIIPTLVSNGFDFHHAVPGSVMMTKWLPTGEANLLPQYPFTQIGVGGIVVREDGRFLLMKEQRGFYLGWKFPGGLVDPGETLFQAATREVSEETSVDAEGVAVLSFRHTLKIKFDSVGDIYFLVIMQLKEGGNDVPRACALEAADAQWLYREQLLDDPIASKNPFLMKVFSQYDNYIKDNSKCFSGKTSTFRGRTTTEYRALEKSSSL